MKYFYVYILQSTTDPDRHYIGKTSDLKRRLSQHNAGNVKHTNKYKPWDLQTYTAFNCEEKATNFEAFLKTGNGRAFARKRL